MNDLKPGLEEAERRVEALRESLHEEAAQNRSRNRFDVAAELVQQCIGCRYAIDAIRGNDETD